MASTRIPGPRGYPKGRKKAVTLDLVPFTPVVKKDRKGKWQPGGSMGDTHITQKELKRIRAERMMELQVKGIPNADIAAAHNIGPDTMRHEIKRAIADGAADRVRERLQKELDKIPNIYAEILDMPADADVSEIKLKVQSLRLKAAKQLADGLGPFQKSGSIKTTVTSTVDLDEFYKLRAARAGEVIVTKPAALPESVTEITPIEEPSDEQKSMGE